MGEIFAGRYELIDPIGQGAMGSVWRVRDLKNDHILAAKVLRQTDAGMLLRFVREQSVRVHHPNIVVPLGWAGEDDRVLFTMPLLSGGNVASLVGDFGPLPPRFVAEVLRQLLDAVAAVHHARLVHRDIKPANILFAATGTERPHAYLSDFGIAVDLAGPRFTESGMIMGTPGYIAPELFKFADPAPTSDLYALGMVCVTMLTALPPRDFEGGIPAPTGVPAALWSLVMDLTATEPEMRPTGPAARARLDIAELQWTVDAIGEVEVFDQLAEPEGSPETQRIAVGGDTLVAPCPVASFPKTAEMVTQPVGPLLPEQDMLPVPQPSLTPTSKLPTGKPSTSTPKLPTGRQRIDRVALTLIGSTTITGLAMVAIWFLR